MDGGWWVESTEHLSGVGRLNRPYRQSTGTHAIRTEQPEHEGDCQRRDDGVQGILPRGKHDFAPLHVLCRPIVSFTVIDLEAEARGQVEEGGEQDHGRLCLGPSGCWRVRIAAIPARHDAGKDKKGKDTVTTDRPDIWIQKTQAQTTNEHGNNKNRPAQTRASGTRRPTRRWPRARGGRRGGPCWRRGRRPGSCSTSV